MSAAAQLIPSANVSTGSSNGTGGAVPVAKRPLTVISESVAAAAAADSNGTTAVPSVTLNRVS